MKYVSKIPRQIYLINYKNDTAKFTLLHKRISKATIYKYNSTKSLLDALYIESLKYTSLKDFKLKMLGYKTSLKKVEFEKYFKYLSKILPIYEKLIWDTTYKKMEDKKLRIEKSMKISDFNSLIKKIAFFYGVNKKEIGLINIAFYPLSFGNRINIYTNDNIKTIGMFIRRKHNLSWLLGSMILHDISNTIYSKSKIMNDKLLNTKKDTIIKEVLSVAISSGWGYNKISNKYAKRPWSKNKEYDKYARIIYPKLKLYLNNNKVIDKEFIKYLKELL